MELATDTGTVVPKGEAAIVTAKGMTELQLLVPDMHERATVPALVLVLTAMMVRATRDPDFVQEQIDWMRAQRS